MVLQTPTHSWLFEVIWDSKDQKSCDARAAILGSIRCDSSFVGERSTPAAPEDEMDDYDWGWWF